jgi:HSP20 family protein
MAIIRWEPFRLEDFPELRLPRIGTDLAVDVYEDDKNVYAQMNLPGVSAEDIDIDVEDDFVRVSGAREEREENKKKNYYYQEIARGTFERSFRLPAKIKAIDTTADFEDGVLTITMPKSAERQPQKIKPARKTTAKKEEKPLAQNIVRKPEAKKKPQGKK